MTLTLRAIRVCLLLSMAAACLHAAASLHGTVVENESGYPLARAFVRLHSVGRDSGIQSVRTDSYGRFAFADLAAGSYVVSASRTAFAPVDYGQKRWRSAGAALTLLDNDAATVTIRLPRYGSITGTLLDENDVGLPEHDVVVYSNTRPPRLLAHARTDDRGVYRLYGLPPARYLVRALAKVYDDGAYLPTFYRDSAAANQARPVEVTLDREVDRIDFHVMPGRLFTVSGRVTGASGTTPSVELSSDTGTESGAMDSDGNFSFKPTAPGQYELLARWAGDRGRVPMAAYQAFTLDRDRSDIRLALAPLPVVQFTVQDSKGRRLDVRDVKLMAVRQDPAGEAEVQTLNLGAGEGIAGRVALLPGKWDVAVQPPNTYYVAGFIPAGAPEPQEGSAVGWNEMRLRPGSENEVKFVLSASPGTISGTVRNTAGASVPGMAVFVEPFDLDPLKRLPERRSVQTNAQGQYTIAGLAPGIYRLLATAEYDAPDTPEFDAAHAVTARVEEGAKIACDLQEYVIPPPER